MEAFVPIKKKLLFQGRGVKFRGYEDTIHNNRRPMPGFE